MHISSNKWMRVHLKHFMFLYFRSVADMVEINIGVDKASIPIESLTLA